jgi:hypothetical protein
LDLPDGAIAAPESLRAHFTAGNLLEVDCTVQIDPR